MQGKPSVEIGEFNAVFTGVVLPIGLRVETVKLTGSELRCAFEPFAAEAPQPGRIEIFVSESDLAEFLNRTSPAGLKNASVEARDGRLRITATKTVLIDVRAFATCNLRVVDGRRLFVDLETIDIMGAGPKQLIQAQLDRINPILDVSQFPFGASIDSVTIGDGRVLLEGRVTP